MSLPTIGTPPDMPGGPERGRPTSWTGSRVAVLFLAWLLASVPGAAIVFVAGLDPAADVVGFVVVLVVQAIITIGIAAVLARRDDETLAQSIGLRFSLADSAGLVWGVLLQIVVALITAPLVNLFDAENAEQAVSELGRSASSDVEKVLFVLGVAVLAPIVEEVLFRGALLRWLLSKMGERPAIVVSAAVFALVHLFDPGALFAVFGLFIIGLVLAWMTVSRDGRIGMAIAVHAGVNMLGALVFVFSDQLVEWEEQLRQTVESLISLF